MTEQELRNEDCGLRSELALRLIGLMAKPKQCECDGMYASCRICIACFIVDGRLHDAQEQIESWESLAENDAAEAEGGPPGVVPEPKPWSDRPCESCGGPLRKRILRGPGADRVCCACLLAAVTEAQSKDMSEAEDDESTAH